jgi:NADH-quinone oxidoreductase subunit N
MYNANHSSAGSVVNAFWVLIFSLIMSSVIGLYYYLRVIVAMFASLSKDEMEASVCATLPWTGWLALASLTVLLLWIGVYPSPLLDTIEAILAYTR